MSRARAQAPATVPHAPPANEPFAPKTFDALMVEFGFKSKRSLRDWCRRRGVFCWPDGGFFWADRNEVAAMIARKRAHTVAPKPAASVESWVESTLGGKARG